jgi:hypothetical protein
MQAFKIENYDRIHGQATFAPFRHLEGEEAESIRAALRERMELREDASSTDVVMAIHSRSLLVSDADAQSDGFDLGRVLRECDCDVSGLVCVNWHHLDDVDEMSTRDVIVHFSDIWYPSSDDVELIDTKLRWVLCIHHSGLIRVLNLAAK